MTKIFPMAALAILAAASSGAANAGVISTDSRVTLAAGACQSALPVFDGVVRKRPLAVQNEGSTSTFITCGLEGKLGAVESSSLIFLGLVNNSSSEATVNCTLVDGRDSISNPVYLPKAVALPANTPIIELSWDSTDNEGANFIYPAVSCSLPPGTGIKAVGQEFVAPVI